jgi:K+ transporter
MIIQPAARTPLRRDVIIGAPGVAFGDNGTSPIYTFRKMSQIVGQRRERGGVGPLVAGVWALMVAVTTKYVCLVMGADNDCEGGIIALLTLASAAVVDPASPRCLRVAAISPGSQPMLPEFGDEQLTGRG